MRPSSFLTLHGWMAMHSPLPTLALLILPWTFATCANTGHRDPTSSTPSAERPPIVTASEWNSTPEPFPDQYVHTPQALLLHHAGVTWNDGDDPFVKLRNLQTWGQRDKGWHDVPYHFLIAPDGRIFEGRAMRYKPDTNTQFDTTGYVNVQLWGNLDTQRATLAQLRSTAALCAWLADELGMETHAITTHRDVAPGQTSCPGEGFYRYVASGQFAHWVDAIRAGQAPAIVVIEEFSEQGVALAPSRVSRSSHRRGATKMDVESCQLLRDDAWGLGRDDQGLGVLRHPDVRFGTDHGDHPRGFPIPGE